MGVRYSYFNYTTEGHGVIEYVDPHYSSDGSNPRGKRTKLKHATRWPKPESLKKPVTTHESFPNNGKSLDQQAWQIFRQRYPGQQPKKGQIKKIRKEILDNLKRQAKPAAKKKSTPSKKTVAEKLASRNKARQDKVDMISEALFRKRFPGQQPNKGQIQKIRQEVIERRKMIGL